MLVRWPRWPMTYHQQAAEMSDASGCSFGKRSSNHLRWADSQQAEIKHGQLTEQNAVTGLNKPPPRPGCAWLACAWLHILLQE